MIGAVVVTVVWVVPLVLYVLYLLRAQRRCYEYAVARADFSERGCAYSDMATVITLDGKADDLRPLTQETDAS